MASLLYKEFVTQRTVILLYLVLAMLYITQILHVDLPFSLISLLAMFFTVNTIAQEDKNNSHILINSLPISRKEVVIAKYLFTIFFGLLLIGIALIYQTVFSPVMLEKGLFHAAMAIVFVIWFIAIYYPLYYWLGPRFVQIGWFIFFILSAATMPMLINLGREHNYWGVVALIQSVPVYILGVLLCGLTGIILLISLFLSVRLYERKEF